LRAWKSRSQPRDRFPTNGRQGPSAVFSRGGTWRRVNPTREASALEPHPLLNSQVLTAAASLVTRSPPSVACGLPPYKPQNGLGPCPSPFTSRSLVERITVWGRFHLLGRGALFQICGKHQPDQSEIGELPAGGRRRASGRAVCAAEGTLSILMGIAWQAASPVPRERLEDGGGFEPPSIRPCTVGASPFGHPSLLMATLGGEAKNRSKMTGHR
jgi:hypothetical protein